MRGIGLSLCRRMPDWAALRAAGYGFAMLRAARGTDGGAAADPLFLQNVRAAAEAGLAVGITHRLGTADPARARDEARAFLQAAEPVRKHISLWACCEICADIQNVYGAADAFLEQVRLQGYAPMLYAAAVHLRRPWARPPFPLYLAYWDAGEAAALRYAPAIWQYASGKGAELGAGSALCRGYFSHV